MHKHILFLLILILLVSFVACKQKINPDFTYSPEQPRAGQTVFVTPLPKVNTGIGSLAIVHHHPLRILPRFTNSLVTIQLPYESIQMIITCALNQSLFMIRCLL